MKKFDFISVSVKSECESFSLMSGTLSRKATISQEWKNKQSKPQTVPTGWINQIIISVWAENPIIMLVSSHFITGTDHSRLGLLETYLFVQSATYSTYKWRFKLILELPVSRELET